MTTSPTVPDRDVLDELARRLSRRGYRLIREPGAADLPDFLGGVRPDAVAVGRSPNLLIEIFSGEPGRGDQLARLETFRHLLADRPDWRLEAVYSRARTPALTPVSVQSIRRRTAEIRQLARTDGAAALVVAWSVLEAVARALAPEPAIRGLSTGSIIELLASRGHIDQQDADRIQPGARVRDMVAHGQLDYDVPTALVEEVLRVAERLTDQLDPVPV